MKINVNQLTQEQFNMVLERIVECAFREGALWEKCGGEEITSMKIAIESAKNNIVYDGNYVNNELFNKIMN